MKKEEDGEPEGKEEGKMKKEKDGEPEGKEEGKMKKEKDGEQPRDLRERTFEFARRVIRCFVALKRDAVSQTLGRQMLRSGTSVGANYREADKARSKAEFISKIGDSLKEADETVYWLELLAAENCLPPKRLAPLIDEARQLVAILTTIKRRAEGK